MSGHIWDVKNFQKGTIARGLKAHEYAKSKGASFEEACTFVGYYLERERQGIGYHKNFDPRNLESMWYSGERSGRRYAQGENGKHYQEAGVRLALLCYLKHISLDSEGQRLVAAILNGEPIAFSLRDWLLDNAHPKEAELL